MPGRIKTRRKISVATGNAQSAAGIFLLYTSTKTPDEERKIITCANRKILKDELDRNILAIYPLSFDNADVSEGFFLSGNLRKGAELRVQHRARRR